MKLDQSVFTYSLKKATKIANSWTKEYNCYYTAIRAKSIFRDEIKYWDRWLVTNKFDPRVIK